MVLQPNLIREATLDQVSRLVHGTYVYFSLLIVLAASTDFPWKNPILFTACSASFAATAILRIVLITRSKILYDRNPRQLELGIWLAVLLAAIPSGILYLSALLFYGLGNWPFTLIVVWTVATVSGASIALTPRIRILAAHLLITFTPALLAGLYVGGLKGIVYSIGSLALMLFLGVQGISLHRAYMGQLQLRSKEEDRRNELEAARAQADSASRFKTQFLANMSHEIRTPMHGILGLSQLALQEEMSASGRQYVEAILSSGNALLAILNEVLDLSKIEAGKLQLTSVSFDLQALISETLLTVSAPAMAKNLPIDVNIHENAPKWLRGDPERIRQVLVNLLGNAVKFTPSGSIQLSVCSSGPLVEFRVTDSGIGIAEEKQKAIFDVFMQADPGVTRKYGGSGLGLAISSRIVELMGGSLQVRSQPGKGSSFWFAIPLEAVELPPAAPNHHQSQFCPLSPLRILVAEDNRVSQRIVQGLLEKYGHHVHLVENGLMALTSWQAEEFDLILIDHQMPEMSGTEAIEQIRQIEFQSRRSRTPAIILTASAMPGDRERFLASGLDGYLAKPFSAIALEKEIARLLGSSET